MLVHDPLRCRLYGLHHHLRTEKILEDSARDPVQQCLLPSADPHFVEHAPEMCTLQCVQERAPREESQMRIIEDSGIYIFPLTEKDEIAQNPPVSDIGD